MMHILFVQLVMNLKVFAQITFVNFVTKKHHVKNQLCYHCRVAYVTFGVFIQGTFTNMSDGISLGHSKMCKIASLIRNCNSDQMEHLHSLLKAVGILVICVSCATLPQYSQKEGNIKMHEQSNMISLSSVMSLQIINCLYQPLFQIL